MELKFTPDQFVEGMVQIQQILSKMQVDDENDEHCAINNIDIVRFAPIGKKNEKDNLKVFIDHETMLRLFSMDDGLEVEKDEDLGSITVVKRYGKVVIWTGVDREADLQDYGFDSRVHEIKFI